ncbi:hypothetical protein DMN91_002377 [Ooceraea biroi]|uniref:Pyridoxal phosphate phosphatase n=1 Tax=Ooceraea biroi TaxID=2015173 RepID=A0A3L8DWH7_OOCBI|nr:4-nitrophenylphosphatase isoform X1 [Ooceraea biroi]RLU24289.1 hypothetical protein DMN91_002377 [Ooceraea biroi]
MSKIKDLSKFSAEELEEFLMSFDIVFSDIDGVIFYQGVPIIGARDSLKRLEELGKQIYLVTNNSTYTEEDYHEMFDIHSNYIINPIKVFTWYLKKIDFHGEILALVSTTVWNTLTEAGLQLVKPQTVSLLKREEVIKEIVDRPSIKAVIIDFDIDCNWVKLALAISCLGRKDVLYLSGATDEWAIVNVQNTVIKILGPGPLINLINTQTGREPLMCSKPSEILKEYVLDTCDVTDPRRCLFIGDSLYTDMKFAFMCGFMKLLVGTGLNSLKEAQEEDDACPDYYLSNLNQLFAAYKD